MSSNTDDHSALKQELMELRRQVAEMSRDIEHLMRDTERQDRNHHELRATVRVGAPAGEQLASALADIKHLKSETRRAARHHEDFAAWAEDYMRLLNTWVEGLGYVVYPKAQLFPAELRRIFPQGFASIPDYRLPEKKKTADHS